MLLICNNLPYIVRLDYIWSRLRSLGKCKYNCLWSREQARNHRAKIERPKNHEYDINTK